MTRPEVWRKTRTEDGEPRWWIRCPGCGTVGSIDEEQYRGEVSIDCPDPECDYHETHDLSNEEKR